MYYISILDFVNGLVDQYILADHCVKTTLAHWQTEDFNEFITSQCYKLNNIEWMSHSDEEIYEY